jgi:hypothetical protein
MRCVRERPRSRVHRARHRRAARHAARRRDHRRGLRHREERRDELRRRHARSGDAPYDPLLELVRGLDARMCSSSAVAPEGSWAAHARCSSSSSRVRVHPRNSKCRCSPARTGSSSPRPRSCLLGLRVKSFAGRRWSMLNRGSPRDHSNPRDHGTFTRRRRLSFEVQHSAPFSMDASGVKPRCAYADAKGSAPPRVRASCRSCRHRIEPSAPLHERSRT